MAGESLITVCGNVTANPELKFIASGDGVASFTVACTPRVKKGDQWEDGETIFYRCSAWRQQAENVAETISRGTRVLVHGKLKVRKYEKDGQERQSIEIDVEHVGPELRYATAKVNKVERGGGGGFSSGRDAQDPWASSGSSDDSPPF